MKHFSVAVDGPGGAGKSTISKEIARRLGIVYMDTGAIYRSVALYCIRNGIDCKNEPEVKKALPEMRIEIKYGEDRQHMMLNGDDVTDCIRTPEVSKGASDVSAHGSVRSYMLDMQRSFARENSVIMDGRDIGTVVLPDADCKIFLTAPAEVRAKRRMKEMQAKGENPSFESVLEEINYRDYQDSHREVAPLRQAEDAVYLDTGDLNFEDSIGLVMKAINEKVNLC